MEKRSPQSAAFILWRSQMYAQNLMHIHVIVVGFSLDQSGWPPDQRCHPSSGWAQPQVQTLSQPKCENAFSHSGANDWVQNDCETRHWMTNGTIKKTSPSLSKNYISMNKMFFKFTADFLWWRRYKLPVIQKQPIKHPEATDHCSVFATTPSSLTAIKWRLWKAHYGPLLKEKKSHIWARGCLLDRGEDKYWVNPFSIHTVQRYLAWKSPLQSINTAACVIHLRCMNVPILKTLQILQSILMIYVFCLWSW